MTESNKFLIDQANDHMTKRQWLEGELKKDGRGILRELLSSSKLSLRKFAKQLDLSPSYISHVLAGHGEVSIELAARLCTYHENLDDKPNVG